MKGRAYSPRRWRRLRSRRPAALAADPPQGAAMSDNLDYVTRVAGARGITEGKFDRVRGDDVLVVTGRFGFKTYDVQRPRGSAGARHVPAAGHRRVQVLAGRGHGARHAPQAHHRRARPAPHRRPLGDCPPAPSATTRPGRAAASVTRTARAASTSSPTPIRRTCARSASSCRCPPATPRAASRSAATSGRAARRGATTRTGSARSCRTPTRGRADASSATAGRSGSPTCATRRTRWSPTSRSTCGATTATRTTPTTSTRTRRASPGSPAAAGSAATRRAAGTATRTRTAGGGRRRSTRCSWPAAAWAAQRSP